MPGERHLWLLAMWSVRSTPVVNMGVPLGGRFRGGDFARNGVVGGGWDSQLAAATENTRGTFGGGNYIHKSEGHHLCMCVFPV